MSEIFDKWDYERECEQTAAKFTTWDSGFDGGMERIEPGSTIRVWDRGHPNIGEYVAVEDVFPLIYELLNKCDMTVEEAMEMVKYRD